jgi:hypothetical protein
MEQQLMAYFGHHKSGTTWISKIIESVCSDLQIKYARFYSPKLFDLDLKTCLARKDINFFSYTNADISYVQNLSNLRGFHVIRDPRDIVVSAYFSHLYSHSTEPWPELVEQRNCLKLLSKSQGLLLTIDFLKYLRVNEFNHNLFYSMYNWNYSMPNVMEIKFEDLINNSSEKFLKIFNFLGIFDNEKILNAVQKNNFSVLSGGRKTGQEDYRNHYRKGMPGDWKNHFEKEHIQYFKSNYNDLLIKLGYETNEDWY